MFLPPRAYKIILLPTFLTQTRDKQKQTESLSLFCTLYLCFFICFSLFFLWKMNVPTAMTAASTTAAAV